MRPKSEIFSYSSFLNIPEPDEMVMDWLPGELELFWNEILCNSFLDVFCKLTSSSFSPETLDINLQGTWRK